VGIGGTQGSRLLAQLCQRPTQGPWTSDFVIYNRGVPSVIFKAFFLLYLSKILNRIPRYRVNSSNVYQVCTQCARHGFRSWINKNENKNHSNERGGQYIIKHSSHVR